MEDSCNSTDVKMNQKPLKADIKIKMKYTQFLEKFNFSLQAKSEGAKLYQNHDPGNYLEFDE